MISQMVQVIHTVFKWSFQHCQNLFKNQLCEYNYTGLHFVTKFNVLFQCCESENNTGSLI